MRLRPGPDAPEHRVAFGNRVRALRLQHGLSQESLALVAGIDRSYLGEVERGQRNITIDNITKIAATLEVPIANLFVSE
jgi:transcriptional regulator with XRE-family HTH domain